MKCLYDNPNGTKERVKKGEITFEVSIAFFLFISTVLELEHRTSYINPLLLCYLIWASMAWSKLCIDSRRLTISNKSGVSNEGLALLSLIAVHSLRFMDGTIILRIKLRVIVVLIKVYPSSGKTHEIISQDNYSLIFTLKIPLFLSPYWRSCDIREPWFY